MSALDSIRDKPCPLCGNMMQRRSKRCIDCYFSTATKSERNLKIRELYSTGKFTFAQLGEMVGLSAGRVQTITSRGSVQAAAELSPATFVRKTAHGKRFGRPPVWPDCPPELQAEYNRLRLCYGYRAGEARAMLEAIRAA